MQKKENETEQLRKMFKMQKHTEVEKMKLCKICKHEMVEKEEAKTKYWQCPHCLWKQY